MMARNLAGDPLALERMIISDTFEILLGLPMGERISYHSCRKYLFRYELGWGMSQNWRGPREYGRWWQ